MGSLPTVLRPVAITTIVYRARGGVAARRSAQGERGRHRGDGYRQGLSQRRGGVRRQRRRIHRDPLTFPQSAIRRHPQHPGEYFAMRVQIDQPPRA